MKTLFVLGPKGTFAHSAGQKAIVILESAGHTGISIVFCQSHAEIFQKTQAGEGFGLIPIENNYAGPVKSIPETLRQWLNTLRLFIVGGVSLPVQHNLLTLPSIKDLSEITEVWTHEQPLLQCKNNLRELGLHQKQETSSTAEAARMLAAGEISPTCAVIASTLAAETYGLKIFRPYLEDKEDNTTRFLILSGTSVVRLLTLGIIGINGKYGKRAEREAAKENQSIIGSDVSTVLSNEEVVWNSNIVIFSVPISKTEKVIRSLTSFSRPNQLWVDFTSIKGPATDAMLHSQAEVVGLHPMIAPTAKSFRGQTIFVHEARLVVWKDRVDSFLKKFQFKVKYGEPEKHDNVMTIVQGLCHAIILIMAMTIMRLKVSLDESMEYASPFYRIILSLVGRILGHDIRLYAEIQMCNPHTLRMLDELVSETNNFRELVRKGNVDEFVKTYEPVREHLGRAHITKASLFFEEILSLQGDLSETNVITVKTNKDYAGLHHRITGVFADAGVNLTISRALGRQKGEFSFVMGGFEQAKDSACILNVVDQLRKVDGVVEVAV